jgi:hypothetical protein
VTGYRGFVLSELVWTTPDPVFSAMQSSNKSVQSCSTEQFQGAPSVVEPRLSVVLVDLGDSASWLRPLIVVVNELTFVHARPVSPLAVWGAHCRVLRPPTASIPIAHPLEWVTAFSVAGEAQPCSGKRNLVTQT